MNNAIMKSAFESMLFVWGDPLEAKVAAEIFGISPREAYGIFKDLAREYDDRESGLMIREVDKSFQLVTRPENNEYIEKLCTPVKEKRLSQSAMEVLAIVAYKQPVTKGEIESIRGIKCDRVIEGLVKKELIQEVGRAPAVGRPILYGTTKAFLENFNFSSLKDLPEIEDIAAVIREDMDPDEEEAKLTASESADTPETDDSQIKMEF